MLQVGVGCRLDSRALRATGGRCAVARMDKRRGGPPKDRAIDVFFLKIAVAPACGAVPIATKESLYAHRPYSWFRRPLAQRSALATRTSQPVRLAAPNALIRGLGGDELSGMVGAGSLKFSARSW